MRPVDTLTMHGSVPVQLSVSSAAACQPARLMPVQGAQRLNRRLTRRLKRRVVAQRISGQLVNFCEQLRQAATCRTQQRPAFFGTGR